MANETIIPLSFGMGHSTNPLNENVLSFDVLKNLYPEDGIIKAEPCFKPYAAKEDGEGIVDNYIMFNSTLQRYGIFGVKIDQAIYAFDPDALPTSFDDPNYIIPLKKVDDLYESVEKKRIYSDYESNGILQYAEWNYLYASVCFFTKLGLPLYQTTDPDPEKHFDYGVAPVEPTFIPDGYEEPVYLSAKYILVTKDRLFLGNVLVGQTYYPARLQWSNLNQPQDFSTGLNKQADYSNLGVNAREITGLAYVHDTVITFCRNCIYRSDYEADANSFRTTLLTVNTGCIYHYSAITVNDLVFFIGKDCFYVLDQFTVVKIGEQIWDWFQENIADQFTDNVIAQYELEQNSVTWVFRMANTNDQAWGIKYNISQKTWSIRSMQTE